VRRRVKTSPASGRVFVIGDIHGCARELELMLDEISAEDDDVVIFLGDYIDRGPDSRRVIEMLIDFKKRHSQTVFLKGNHEDMMLSYFGLPGRHGDCFLLNGGFSTLQSYGVSDPQHALEHIPQAHLEFLKSLENYKLQTSFLCVHAGIRPSLSLEQQSEEDMLWIRHEFILSPHSLGLTVIFGHTPMREVMLDLPYKIGIDTGLVYGGKLSCVELSEGILYQLAKGGSDVKVKRLSLR